MCVFLYQCRRRRIKINIDVSLGSGIPQRRPIVHPACGSALYLDLQLQNIGPQERRHGLAAEGQATAMSWNQIAVGKSK